MSYIKAADVLPEELIELVQKYVDGEYLYIPRRDCNRKAWGENTRRKQETHQRNVEIYRQYQDGCSVANLSESFYLSPKSIQKIIAEYRRNNS